MHGYGLSSSSWSHLTGYFSRRMTPAAGAPHQVQKFPALKRLGDVTIHSGVQAPFAVAFHGVGGHGDDLGVPAAQSFAGADFSGRRAPSITGICRSIRIKIEVVCRPSLQLPPARRRPVVDAMAQFFQERADQGLAGAVASATRISRGPALLLSPSRRVWGVPRPPRPRVVRGMVKWNVLPLPSRLSTQIRPPPSSTSRGRSPAQAGAAVLARGRTVGLVESLEDGLLLAPAESRFRCRGRRSATHAVAVATRPSTSTALSPRSVNLMALPSRFSRTWRKRPGSPTSAFGTFRRHPRSAPDPSQRPGSDGVTALANVVAQRKRLRSSRACRPRSWRNRGCR